MFCKNCGKPMNENQAICLECGVKAGEGNHFCANCGQPIAPNAAVCTQCGVAVANTPADGAKRKLVALLLAIFLGGFGALLSWLQQKCCYPAGSQHTFVLDRRGTARYVYLGYY